MALLSYADVPKNQPYNIPLLMPPLPNKTVNEQNVGRNLSYGFAPKCFESNAQNPHIGWSPNVHKGETSIETEPTRAQVEILCQAIRVPDEDMPIYPNMVCFPMYKHFFWARSLHLTAFQINL